MLFMQGWVHLEGFQLKCQEAHFNMDPKVITRQFLRGDVFIKNLNYFILFISVFISLTWIGVSICMCVYLCLCVCVCMCVYLCVCCYMYIYVGVSVCVCKNDLEWKAS